jgi:hypothetical protein
VTATGATPEQQRLSTADGNVLSGGVIGVNVQSARNQVVLFPADHAGTATTSAAKYTVRATGDADHVLVDVAPSASGYAVTATVSGSNVTVDVRQGGTFMTTAQGSLSFAVTASGAVSPSSFAAAAAAQPAAPAPTPTPTPTAPAPTTTTTSAPAPAPAPAPTTTTAPTSDVIATTTVATFSAKDLSVTSMYGGDGVTFKDNDRLYAYVTSYAAKALLKFDVSSIPSTATVASARLDVMVESWINGAGLSGDFLTTSWDYATVGNIHATSGTTWTQAGIGTSDVANKPFTFPAINASGNQKKSVDLDAAQIQAWIANAAANRGLVVSNPTSGILRIFSSEASNAVDRPTLTVTYRR